MSKITSLWKCSRIHSLFIDPSIFRKYIDACTDRFSILSWSVNIANFCRFTVFCFLKCACRRVLNVFAMHLMLMVNEQLCSPRIPRILCLIFMIGSTSMLFNFLYKSKGNYQYWLHHSTHTFQILDWMCCECSLLTHFIFITVFLAYTSSCYSYWHTHTHLVFTVAQWFLVHISISVSVL